MGYPAKVQLIKRRNSRQFYVGLPTALAAALELRKGETVEWVIRDKNTLFLKRVEGGSS